MTSVPIPRFFLNSLIVTVVSASIKLLLAMLTAYALVFVRFPFKRVIFLAILVALMVPPQVAILPNYVLIAGWGGGEHLLGASSCLGWAPPSAPSCCASTSSRSLRRSSRPPRSTEPATGAHCGAWSPPISLPSIATVALVTIVTEWNDYIWPLIITTESSMMTLPVGGLTTLQNSEGNTGSGWGGSSWPAPSSSSSPC